MDARKSKVTSQGHPQLTMLGRGVVRAAKAAAPLRGGGSHPPHPKWVWSPAGGWQWQDVWSPVCAPSPLIHPTTIRTAGSSLLGQRAGGADGPARILAMASDRTENLSLDACCRAARAPERYAGDGAGVITISMPGGGAREPSESSSRVRSWHPGFGRFQVRSRDDCSYTKEGRGSW